jgi:phenylpropionate dioxygenase-like ring-hydroxylating dioxygenase large terminal subunit
MGEDLILVRSPEGKAALMEGHCTHRGASLGHGGTFVGNCVQCPFHGFQYDLTGKCVAIPNVDRIPVAAVLKTFPLAETLGMIWMFNGPEPTFPPPTLEGFGIIREIAEKRPDVRLGTAYAFRNVRNCLMRDSICGSLDYKHATLVHKLQGRLISIEEPTPHQIIVTSEAEYLDWGPFQYRRILGKHVRYIGHYWGPAIVYTHVVGKLRTLGHIRACLPIEEQLTQTDMLFVARLNKKGKTRRLAVAFRTRLGRQQDDEDLFLDHQKPRAMYIKNFDEGMIAHHRMCQRMGQTATVGREPWVADDVNASAPMEDSVLS